MFGYVKPQHTELLVREYDFYRATYCGICRSMKKHTGLLSNITLSYDSVFLALVRMLYISDCDISSGMKRCIAHPMKKKCMLNENPATEYTARAFAILTYYKLCDDAADEGLARRTAIAFAKPTATSAVRKAGYPDLAAFVKQKLDGITKLEKNNTPSVDRPAELFGELLGAIFAEGLDESDKLVPMRVGFHLGKFIYAADAAEDYATDVEKGRYNPYAELYGREGLTPEIRSNIKCALLTECKNLEAAVNLLPFGNRLTIKAIIENIIYLGLPKRIGFLDGTDCEIIKGAEQ